MGTAAHGGARGALKPDRSPAPVVILTISLASYRPVLPARACRGPKCASPGYVSRLILGACDVHVQKADEAAGTAGRHTGPTSPEERVRGPEVDDPGKVSERMRGHDAHVLGTAYTALEQEGPCRWTHTDKNLFEEAYAVRLHLL